MNILRVIIEHRQLLQRIVLTAFLLAFAVIDIRKRIIPNKLVLVMAVMGLLLSLLSLDSAAVLADLAAFFGVGILLTAVSWVSKGALGMGDVKLMMCVALFIGLGGMLGYLFLSFLCSALFSMIMLLVKKVNRKTLLPMAPFLFAGSILNALLI